jgi:hypothetical protein
MTGEKIDDAMAALFGPVPKRYSEAITARWAALAEETAATRAINDSVKLAERDVRHYISDRLLSRKVRRQHPRWWLSWDRTSFHYINHDRTKGKPEMIGPYVEFTLWLGSAWRIKVETTIRDRAHLDEILLNVEAMAHAQAEVQGR